MARARKIRSKDILILVFLLMWKEVVPSAIGEHQGESREKDVANNLSGNLFNRENRVGDKLNQNQNVLSENKSNNFVGAIDTGRFNNQDIDKKIYDENKVVGGHSFNQDSGERNQGVSTKKGHKKGHHNSGFRNSYHKDESSNNSSYFDDYSDEADQSNQHRDRGRYDNEAGNRYDTRREDGIHHIKDNSRQGNYDRRAGNEARNVDNQDFNRNRYHDDSRDISQQRRDENFAARDRGFVRSEEAPHRHGSVYPLRPYAPRPAVDYHRDYYDDPRRLPPPIPVLRRHDYRDELRPQTITIFEDPRLPETFHDRGVHHENSDLIRLDVRPGAQRYQRFDNFYNTRPDWGVNRRSNINPLVFNYNRY